MSKFQLLVIGNEILSGRRQDAHFAQTLAAFDARGLRLSAVHFLSDDGERLTAHFRRALQDCEVVLSCGGIGATPDDRTRQAVAEACGVPLVFHPEGEEILRAKYGEADFTPERRELVAFPQGAALIPNPVNSIPGFSLRGIFCVPGFPQMAQPMITWVLDRFFRDTGHERCYLALDVFAPESALAPVMVALEARFPQVSVSSLPKLHFECELGFDGSPGDCQVALTAARELLDAAGLEWQVHVEV